VGCLLRRGLMVVGPRLHRRHPAVFYGGGPLGPPASRNPLSKPPSPPLDATVSPSSLSLSPLPPDYWFFFPAVRGAKPPRPGGAAGGVRRPEEWSVGVGGGTATSAPTAAPSPPAQSEVCSAPPSPPGRPPPEGGAAALSVSAEEGLRPLVGSDARAALPVATGAARPLPYAWVVSGRSRLAAEVALPPLPPAHCCCHDARGAAAHPPHQCARRGAVGARLGLEVGGYGARRHRAGGRGHDTGTVGLRPRPATAAEAASAADAAAGGGGGGGCGSDDSRGWRQRRQHWRRRRLLGRVSRGPLWRRQRWRRSYPTAPTRRCSGGPSDTLRLSPHRSSWTRAGGVWRVGGCSQCPCRARLGRCF